MRCQGGSVIKPLAGLANDGPSDASVNRPMFDSKKGIVISNGINFRFGFIDPYWMAASCIDEALRQIIAVGGSLKEVAVLDNFCWGNPDKPDRLGSLVRASYGCYDAAKEYGVPFISGKDSLYNEFSVHGKSTPIPGTLLISAIGVMDDVGKAVSMYAKKAGNLIYVVGRTRDELGGSHYYDLYGAIGNCVPKVRYGESKKIFSALSKASQKDWLKLCMIVRMAAWGLHSRRWFSAAAWERIYSCRRRLMSRITRAPPRFFFPNQTRVLW